MRTITLGILIVCGGTLAALPFRRYQATSDASTESSQVTGPTGSVLQVSGAETANEAAASVPSLTEIDRYREITAYTSPTSYAPGSDLPTRRHIDIPLTYEDLAVPIDQPKPIVERFSATASVRKQQLDAEKIAGLVMPPLESLPIEQQHALMRSTQKSTDNEQEDVASASGRLASVPLLKADEAEPRSKGSDAETATTSDRERFWIRQPK